MVEVILAKACDHASWGGGAPLIHIHTIKRHVHGNSISIRVAGEMKIAAKEVVFAKEFKVNTIQTLVLTPEHMAHTAYVPSKYIHHKGEYDNYASIDVIKIPGGGDANAEQTAGEGPSDGSIWLDFVMDGE